MYLIIISGIFGRKSDELDLLPPPPPFPKFEDAMVETEKIRKSEVKPIEKKQTIKKKDKHRINIEWKKIEEDRIKQKELDKKLVTKKKDKEYLAKKEPKKTFHFFNKLGFIKSEEEKKEHERHRHEYEKLKAFAKDMEKEEKKKLSEDRRKQKDIKIFQKDKDRFRGAEKRSQKDLQLNEKQEEDQLDRELKELEKKILDTPKEEEIKDVKLETPSAIFGEEIQKPKEIIKAEEEIQNAIEGIKRIAIKEPKKGLFRKEVVEKVEQPDIMPRIDIKVDNIELIEEKIHKARLELMNFKFDESKRIYIEIMKIYNELDKNKKLKVYQEIKDLYFERKSADKFAK